MKNYKSHNQRLVPGIYGGMGPASHIYFEKLLIQEYKLLGASSDQEFPVYFLVSGSSTPDRTESINGGKDAKSHLIHFAKLIERYGADFLVIVCNTAHAYLDAIKNAITIPIVSLIDETANFIYLNNKSITKIGLLATDGTLKTNLYQHAFAKKHIKIITPDISSNIQEKVMSAIYNKDYGIKYTGTKITTKAIENVEFAVQWLLDNDVDGVIAGCTEISLILKDMNIGIPIFDPLKILANKVASMSIIRTEKTNKSDKFFNYNN